jgi:hypothetical protein
MLYDCDDDDDDDGGGCVFHSDAKTLSHRRVRVLRQQQYIIHSFIHSRREHRFTPPFKEDTQQEH